jgi:hypothetical protein
MPGHGGWGITVGGGDETVIAHNLIGLAQDAAIMFRNIESRIVTGRGGVRMPGPLARVPDTATKISIDPRR